MERKADFLTVYVAPNYGVETLINGNINECINYLRELSQSGRTGNKVVHEELNAIKERCPDRYDYILNNVYRY